MTVKKSKSSASKKTYPQWRLLRNSTLRQISSRIFQIFDNKKVPGGRIVFSCTSNVDDFLKILNNPVRNLSHSTWITLDPEVQIIDPIFVNDVLPNSLHVRGRVTLQTPTFDNETMGGSFRIAHIENPDDLFQGGVDGCTFYRPEFVGHAICVSSSPLSNVRIERAGLYMTKGVVKNTTIQNTILRLSRKARVEFGVINEYSHPMIFQNVGSEDGTLTAFLNKDNKIVVARGCFIGSIKEFQAALRDPEYPGVLWKAQYPKLLQVIAASFIERGAASNQVVSK